MMGSVMGACVLKVRGVTLYVESLCCSNLATFGKLRGWDNVRQNMQNVQDVLR